MTPTFSGEMQLAGWVENHNSGAKITFWLPDSNDLEVFKGLTARKGNTAGHRFAVVLVEIGDDELPVDPDVLNFEQKLYTSSEHVQKTPEIKHKGGELAKWAGMLCRDREFELWLSNEYPREYVDCLQDCATWIREKCNVDSRAELDHNQEAGRIFREQVMAPFAEWKEAQK